jgi:hypothetical protein
MISTPGHRVLRRRQRRAPPAWLAIRVSVSQVRFETIPLAPLSQRLSQSPALAGVDASPSGWAFRLFARIISLDLAVFVT